MVELLVVIAIVALAVGIVTLALPDREAAELDEEAARLSALLEMARVESRVAGVAVRWVPRAANPETRAPAAAGGAEQAHFEFVGLAGTQRLPNRWLNPATQVFIPGAPFVVLGPDAILPAQRVVLRLGERRVEVGSDGLAPFAPLSPLPPPGPSTTPGRTPSPGAVPRRADGPGRRARRGRSVSLWRRPPAGRRPPGLRQVPVPASGPGRARHGAGTRVPAGGFTLLEVLVALAVSAIALAAGLRAAGVMTDNADRLQQVTVAQWCADNQLTELRLRRMFPGVGDSDFSCEQLGRTYSGKLVTRPTPNPAFRRVDARVSDEQGRLLVSVSTVLARP